MHFGGHDKCGHAVGLLPEVDTHSFLLFDSHHKFALRINDEVLYDSVVQYKSASRHCCVLRVAEGDPEAHQIRTMLLDTAAGAPTHVDRRAYDQLLDFLDGDNSVQETSMPAQLNNETRKLGIQILQERAAVRNRADSCNHLRVGVAFGRICVCRALHDLGLPVHVHRNGPEWVASGGTEMLKPFGLCIRRCGSLDALCGGKFVVHDGDGHAFALHVGAYSIVSFRTGLPELISSSSLDTLFVDACSGMIEVFGIYPCDSWCPFQHTWSPPWSQPHEQDALCGANRATKSSTPITPSSKTETTPSTHVDQDRRGAMLSYRKCQPASSLRDVCLPVCFRIHGIPVPITQSGPFWALQDGNVMLKPYGYCVVPVPSESLFTNGRYIIHQVNHFYNIRVLCAGLVCWKIDGHATEFLESDQVSQLIYDTSVKVFLLQPIHDSVFLNGAWMPPWFSSNDVAGGVKSTKPSKCTATKSAPKTKASLQNKTKADRWPTELVKVVHEEAQHWRRCADDMGSHTEFGHVNHWTCPMCPA